MIGNLPAAKSVATRVVRSRPAKRSFRIAGHATSISLEAAFWDALTLAAARLDLPVSQLIADIDSARGDTNLSSAVRVWILRDLQAQVKNR